MDSSRNSFSLFKRTCILRAFSSGDKFIGDPIKKAELHKLFNADICEMESAGIALTCNRNRIPFLMIKCVADSCGATPQEYYTNFNKSASLCFDITDKIIKGII